MLAGTLLVNVVEIFSGATIIISLFASILTELISTNPSVMVNLVLNPVVEGESYLTICYERLGPIFVEAIKELTNEIKELKKENIFIKSELERIKLSI